MTTASPRALFAEYLLKKGLRNTSQREDILAVFYSAGKHLTIEELHSLIKKKNPAIGYATVHRNLKLLCECGLGEEIRIGRQKARYEPKLGQEHHDHLICLRCGKFIEVRDDKIEKLQNKLAEANDFTPLKHKLEIFGICKGCR